VALTDVRWTEDVAVSGRIDKPVARHGVVRASLHLAVNGGAKGDLLVEWPEGVADSDARIRGTLDGTAVMARTAAP
jgi:hypothetical protein